MNTQHATAHVATSHEDWELRVQDWLDGTADQSEAMQVEAHLATCGPCTQLVAELRAMDEELASAVRAPALDRRFDTALFAKIDAEETARKRNRAAALAQEPESRTALDRSLRKSLLTVLGVISMAVLFLAWAFVAGPLSLSPAALAVKVASISPLQWLAFGAATAGVSTLLVRWIHS